MYRCSMYGICSLNLHFCFFGSRQTWGKCYSLTRSPYWLWVLNDVPDVPISRRLVHHAADRSHRWGTLDFQTDQQNVATGLGRYQLLILECYYIDVISQDAALLSRSLDVVMWCNPPFFLGDHGPEMCRTRWYTYPWTAGEPEFLESDSLQLCYSICVAISSGKNQLTLKVHYFFMQGVNFQPKCMFFSCCFPLALLQAVGFFRAGTTFLDSSLVFLRNAGCTMHTIQRCFWPPPRKSIQHLPFCCEQE